MLRAFVAPLAIGVLLTASNIDNTGWLESGHPRIEIMFDHTLKADCKSDCDRYAMLLRYESSTPPTTAETAEWADFSAAGCVDVVAGSKTTFACRVPGTISRNQKDGSHYAMSRFHMTRAQLDDLITPTGLVRVQHITLQMPATTRAALQTFLSGPGKLR